MQSWIREIERARTEAEVVATARDYVSLWSPAELREFPEDCRVIRIETHADIPRLRDRLLHGFARTHEHPPRVQDLVSFVSRASDRLGELRTKG
jgi:hypothetical protein